LGKAKLVSILVQHGSTRIEDFINKYHKKPIIWSNKIAYLAGLVDGEGYLKVEKHGTIRLVIGMSAPKAIYWVYNNFGGNVTKQKRPNGKPFYVWRMNQGKSLLYLLLLLIPFLVTKKDILTEAMKDMIDKFSEKQHTIYPHKIRSIK